MVPGKGAGLLPGSREGGTISLGGIRRQAAPAPERCRAGMSDRQVEAEAGASGGGLDQPAVAAVGNHDLAGDRKAQPRPPGTRRPGAGLEEMLPGAGRPARFTFGAREQIGYAAWTKREG